MQGARRRPWWLPRASRATPQTPLSLPTLRDRADFPSCGVVASLLGYYPTSSAPPCLRGNLPRSRPRRLLRQAPGAGDALPDLHFRSPGRAPAADGHQFPGKKAARAIVAAGFPLQLQAVFAIRPFYERGVFFHVDLRGAFHVTQGDGGGILDVEFLGLGTACLPTAQACSSHCQRQCLDQCTAGHRAIHHGSFPLLKSRSTMQKSSGSVTSGYYCDRRRALTMVLVWWRGIDRSGMAAPR